MHSGSVVPPSANLTFFLIVNVTIVTENDGGLLTLKSAFLRFSINDTNRGFGDINCSIIFIKTFK